MFSLTNKLHRREREKERKREREKEREKDVRFTLADTPKALASFQSSLSEIPGIIHPGQDMVDWIIANRINLRLALISGVGESAKAHHMDPPLRALFSCETGYLSAASTSADRQSALDSWDAQSRQARRPKLTREVPIRSCSLYILRFFDRCGNLPRFLPFLAVFRPSIPFWEQRLRSLRPNTSG